jgi:hypothetical protein
VTVHPLSKPDGVEEITDHLVGRFDHRVAREALRTRVRRHFAAMQEAPIRDFVPLFVERRVRAELRRAT